MQKVGATTVSVIRAPFVDMAKSVGRAMGYADLPMVVLPTPFEMFAKDQIRELADAKLDEIVSKLSEREGASKTG